MIFDQPMKKNSFIILVLLVGLCFSACLDKDYFKISVPTPTPDLRIPLVKLNTTLGELADTQTGNTRVATDSEGRLTFFYEGQLIRQSALGVFPPLPLFQDFIIADSVAPLELPLEDNWILEKGTFKQSSVRFKFKTTIQENITVQMTMPELSKDGEVFVKNFVMSDYSNGDNYFESELISLDGYDFETDDSTLNFNYDARDESGNRIVFDEAFMFIDVVRFSYLQGYFGKQVFNLTGSTIPIGIFNNWTSGGFSFDKPAITIGVVNSFGFPVSSFFNRLDVNTLSGDNFEIESMLIDNGIEFAYPTLSQIGDSLATSFSITPDNSNIEEVFNEKATQLNYDIEAIVNPDEVNPVSGFFLEESYFTINASVEVPLHVKINDLVLTKNFDLDLEDYAQVGSGELIIVVKNALPLNTELQFLFEDETGEYQEYLDNTGWTAINPRDVAQGGIQEQMSQVIRYPISETNWDNIRQSKSMAVNMRLNTDAPDPDGYLWFYDYHGIDLKISAIINQD